MNPQPGVPRWRVQSQLQTRQPGPNGQFVTGVEVGFVTAHNVVGSVFVPQSQYNAQTVKALIDERVKVVEAVHELRG